MQEKLGHSEEEMICLFGPDGLINYANDCFCKIMERNASDVIGSHISDYWPDDADLNFIELIRQLQVERVAVERVYELNRRGKRNAGP